MTPTQQERRIQALYDDSNVPRRNLCERVVHLEADMEDVRAENVRLREVVSDGEENARLILQESRQLEAENAKLRELAAEALRYINHPADASWTHEKREEVRNSLNDRMRELGVKEPE